MIEVIVLRVRRATASSGLPPKPDISLRRLGDAKGQHGDISRHRRVRVSNFAQIPREGAPIVNSGSAPHI